MTANGEVPDAAKLTGGSKGKTLTPDEADFETALVPVSGAGGLYYLDRIALFNLLCIPGETKPAILSSLQHFCRDRRAFLIADCASTAIMNSLQNGPDTALTGDDAINAAFYFPWVNAPDPLQENRPAKFPPCGFAAGLYARTDSSRGVWKAPAGTDASLAGASSPSIVLTNDENGVLNPKAVNCIRSLPVYGTVLWGARTLRGNDEIGSEWKYIPVRRTALFIEESLYRALKWVVFEPNDEPLWSQIRLNIGAFMHNLFRQGAFQGSTPRDAYLVKCDKETTTQADINLGIVNIVVGFAPLKPAEFVIIKIQQIAGQIET
jgi:phage tail sheath protein FI